MTMAILEYTYAVHPAFPLECHPGTSPRAVAQPVSVVEDGNLLWREDAAISLS
jgi:hypothetical protein